MRSKREVGGKEMRDRGQKGRGDGKGNRDGHEGTQRAMTEQTERLWNEMRQHVEKEALK